MLMAFTAENLWHWPLGLCKALRRSASKCPRGILGGSRPGRRNSSGCERAQTEDHQCLDQGYRSSAPSGGSPLYSAVGLPIIVLGRSRSSKRFWAVPDIDIGADFLALGFMLFRKPLAKRVSLILGGFDRITVGYSSVLICRLQTKSSARVLVSSS